MNTKKKCSHCMQEYDLDYFLDASMKFNVKGKKCLDCTQKKVDENNIVLMELQTKSCEQTRAMLFLLIPE